MRNSIMANGTADKKMSSMDKVKAFNNICFWGSGRLAIEEKESNFWVVIPAGNKFEV
jgi:hypothetical protein